MALAGQPMEATMVGTLLFCLGALVIAVLGCALRVSQMRVVRSSDAVMMWAASSATCRRRDCAAVPHGESAAEHRRLPPGTWRSHRMPWSCARRPRQQGLPLRKGRRRGIAAPRAVEEKSA
jgi:hypothetical protein